MAHRPPIPRVLLAAALLAEVLPLLRRLQRPRLLDRRLVAGLLAGRSVAVLRTGVGRKRAERRTRAALARYHSEIVVSLGTCGALTDELCVGQLVSAQRILGLSPAPSPFPNALPVTIATVARPVFDQRTRQRWHERGAQVCEMEAAGVAAAAQGRQFHALKVISDMAGRGHVSVHRRPRALSTARFLLRAWDLSERQLAPAVVRWLAEEG